MMLLLARIALLGLLGLSDAAGNAKDLGSQALNSGHPAEAYRLWLPLAEHGDREVQEAVAMLLGSNQDIGVTLSRDERMRMAREWLVSSARNGQVSAMEWLADAFAHGWDGFPANANAAACWRDAASGHSSAAACEMFVKQFEAGT